MFGELSMKGDDNISVDGANTMFNHRSVRFRYDIILGILLLILGTSLGLFHLRLLHTEKSAIEWDPFVYGPAVMIAYGYGSYNPDWHTFPALHAFLRGEREDLPRDLLPEKVPVHQGAAANYHKYLNYTIALFWRLLGVSWSSVEPMMALMLGWSAVAVYCLMRLGMRRLFAVVAALAFIVSPGVLFVLTDPRDFSKAPFILSILFLLFWLIKNKASFLMLLSTAIPLGLLTGIAMGFRQDIIIFVPPAIAVLGVSGWRMMHFSYTRWTATILLYLACFLAMAWPMFSKVEGGAQFENTLIQGFSIQRMVNLGISPPAYELLVTGEDTYVVATLYDYNRRMGIVPEEQLAYDTLGAVRAGRQHADTFRRIYW